MGQSVNEFKRGMNEMIDEDVRAEEGTTTRASVAFPPTAGLKGTVLLGANPPAGTAWVRDLNEGAVSRLRNWVLEPG